MDETSISLKEYIDAQIENLKKGTDDRFKDSDKAIKLAYENSLKDIPTKEQYELLEARVTDNTKELEKEITAIKVVLSKMEGIVQGKTVYIAVIILLIVSIISGLIVQYFKNLMP